jgi:hypothetical protein
MHALNGPMERRYMILLSCQMQVADMGSGLRLYKRLADKQQLESSTIAEAGPAKQQ